MLLEKSCQSQKESTCNGLVREVRQDKNNLVENMYEDLKNGKMDAAKKPK